MSLPAIAIAQKCHQLIHHGSLAGNNLYLGTLGTLASLHKTACLFSCEEVC